MVEQLTLDIRGYFSDDDKGRSYTRTHPWITFRLDLDRAPAHMWVLMGEAQSKCESLGRIPLPPYVSEILHFVYLAKGVHGTTAIEGNTLSEEQVKKIAEKKLELPPSMEYLQKEVTNIIEACGLITGRALEGKDPRISPELLCELNRLTLSGLDLDDEIDPGCIRQHNVEVMRYGAPNWEDCRHLVGRLCDFLNRWADQPGRDTSILRAIIAHLYLAWIHPFGDGNGRTARLLEFHILVNSGMPTLAAHLMSNHYSQTRTKYLQELDRASKSGGDVMPFLIYALEGFVDQLRQQVTYVQAQQLNLSWRDYVYEKFRERESDAMHRRRDLLLALSWRESPVRKSQIRTLSPELEKQYRGKTDKTISRDLGYLRSNNLVLERGGGYEANTNLILQFLPERRVTHLEEEAKKVEG